MSPRRSPLVKSIRSWVRKLSAAFTENVSNIRSQNLSYRHPYFFLVILLVYGIVFESTLIISPSATTTTKQQQTQLSSKNKPLLRPSNVEILQKSQPVDMVFVQRSASATDGIARDDQGQDGYVPDVTALRQNPPGFNLTGGELKDACQIRDSDYKMIHEKVAVDASKKQTKQQAEQKILCVVQTSGHRHYDRIPALRRTWGPKCDGFVVASNVTDPALGTVHIPHGGTLDDPHMRGWLRVRSTWSFIYDNYYDQYDWFYFSNDMVFLLVENLRLYLASLEIIAATRYNQTTNNDNDNTQQQIPLFMGRRFALGGNLNDIFNAAGPGYVVNKAALKVFVVQAESYVPQQHTSKEDLMMARTFAHFGVFPYDTQDDTGGERFMITTPGHHYESQFPAWYHQQSIGIQHGVDHCSTQSISFHYVNSKLMYRLYALLYGNCKR
ncbi:acetylgalactosamine 3-beta-galactosyltransferase 1 [Seminavis robusta]|uniref:Acetylgalactosamine 3-beta-galactosyltransferase 1 n=1 Tax=Seminavis robusta TaxID=568900 RepID=A0A9N8HBA1_9STRA|nr:acetylgalactosamine 3-beta-galactosyltransferase 1 [Seminavis robusta]|eukprot:Sro353_g124680.1 acetylgalactosamine 3-beta-galactosyltransferase 1 (440) ;mRNA; f:70051-71519